LLTLDQVIALAPDAASVKAARPLAQARKWDDWATDESCLWGLAQGSGKKPYQTRIDLGEPAFKCSCPSRKFPCKHALALMFLAAANPDEVPRGTPPDWVREWMEGRATRAEQKKKAATQPGGTTADPKAAAKRRDKKINRIDDGVLSLKQFLEDLARQGLAEPAVKAAETWDDLARRMIDAQAPGLAGFLRGLRDLAQASGPWETPFLHALGNLHLLLHSWSQRPSLDPDLRAEIEQLIGLPVSKEEVLASKALPDQWYVAARSLTEQDRLQTSITWLWGTRSERWAKVLKFAAQGQAPPEPWPVGASVETSLHFYPGVTNPRALPTQENVPFSYDKSPESTESFATFLDRYASLRARNPWHRFEPLFADLRPGEAGTLIDREGKALPAHPGSSTMLHFEALSGGHAIPTCGEWNGHSLRLLSAVSDGQMINLTWE
jgi:hypothetical protein